ncbi:MAG: BMP family ABC transporter substrate-binding protein [Alphaproteobacteria bacterium]
MMFLKSVKSAKHIAATLAIAAALIFANGASHASDPFKVGFIYVGPIGDHGWSYQHDQARLAVEEHFGDKVTTAYVENVPEGADAERVLDQLVAAGNQLIFSTSFGFMNPTLKVAKRNPDILFEHATGFKTADNVGIYNARFYEGRYVAGQTVAKLTKSNIIGYIASFPIPEVVMGVNATLRGARAVNPDVEIRVVWVNSWFDPGKEADAAKTLIDQGADIIMQHTDSPAPMQVAQERGVWAVGQASDMSSFGEDAHVTAIVNNWAPYYIERIQAAIDGNWSVDSTWGGFQSGMLYLSDFNKGIPENIVAEARALEAKIKAGEVHPFQGPVIDQNGNERLAAGEIMDDRTINSMDYFVEGVIGTVPN